MNCLLPLFFRLMFAAIAPASADWFTQVWKYPTGGRIYATPAVGKGIVFVGSTDNYLYAIHSVNGRQRWKFKTGGAVVSGACIRNGKVFFGSMDGNYYAVDSSSGKLCWKFATGGEHPAGGKGYWGLLPADREMTDLWDFFLSTPVAGENYDDHRLYFGSSDGHLYCVDQRNGKLIWKQDLHSAIHSTPALANGMVYAGTWMGDMIALDAVDGRVRWKFATGGSGVLKGIQASPVIAGNRLYFGARDGNAYALDAGTGSLSWKYSAGDSWLVGTPAVKDSLVFFSTSDSFQLLALDTAGGNPLFTFKACGYLFSSPSIAGDKLYIGDFTGQLYALSISSSGKQWGTFKTSSHVKYRDSLLRNGVLDFSYAAHGKSLSHYQTNLDVMNAFHSLGSFVSSPVISDTMVYIGSSDGQLYALRRH